MFHSYKKYYFIPWPESQKILEMDINGEHTIITESMDIMAECDWIDNLSTDKNGL